MRILDIVLALFLLITLVGCVRSLILLRRYRYRPTGLNNKPDDLPSVSICIAARNERHALSQCLEHVLASDYEKMEVLVLDDSSDDDTSFIIKSFAQGGVRFIAGQSLPDGWLGKNHAYHTLAQEANGDVVLFLDVDTLLSPTSLSKLVNAYQHSSASMVSVMPRREDGYRGSALMGTLRYFWELVLSTRLRPPAASSLFMMERKTFTTLMEEHPNLSSDIRIEKSLTSFVGDTYHFIVATKQLGIRYEKRWQSQIETTTRLYYPSIGSNFWLLLLAISVLAGVAMVGIIPSWVVGGDYAFVGDICFLATCLLFGIFTSFTMSGGWWNIALRAILWPILIIQELSLLVHSFVRYKLAIVTWKGRRVTAQPTNHSYHKIDE